MTRDDREQRPDLEDERQRPGTKADRDLANWVTQINKVVEDSVNSAMDRMKQMLTEHIAKEARCYNELLPRVLVVEKAQQAATEREDHRIGYAVTCSVIASVLVVGVLLWAVVEYKLFRVVAQLLTTAGQ